MRTILIPQDPAASISEQTLEVGTDLGKLIQELQRLLGGYFEIVRTRQLHQLMHGHDKVNWSHRPTVVMLVDEDGISHGRPRNTRASWFYDGDIYGDAILMAEVDDREGGYDIGSLPDSITPEKVAGEIDYFIRS